MISNIVLSEIESFPEIFNDVVDVLFEKEEMKVISSILISPETKEFILETNLEEMTTLKQIVLDDRFKNVSHITLKDRIYLCPLKKDEKQFEENDFEFILAIYSKSNILVGALYGALDGHYQESLVNHLHNNVLMLLLENTVHLLCQKFSSYNRLFYSVNKYLELLSVKDKNMPNHMTNVANLSLDMAKRVKLNVLDTIKLYIAALLHDIGKLYIEDGIINNKKKYSYNEFETIKTHSIKGAEMAKSELSDLPLLHDVPNIIESHHERYDGSGYPKGLKGEDIPYLSRILMLADSIDAMLTHRTYKKEKDRKSVMKELSDCSGSLYDASLVAIALDVLKASRLKYNIKEVVGNNYIHNVSLAYFHGDINHSTIVSGSLVMQKDTGNFMLSNPFDHAIDKVQGAKICFYYLNDIYEYGVDIDRLINGQLIIKNFNFSPLEENFAIAWRQKTSVYYPKSRKWDGKVIRIGSSSLVFEVNTRIKNDILNRKNETLTVPLHLKTDGINEFVEVECKVMQCFEFDDMTVMFSKILGVKDNKKEKLIRALFKKHIFDRKIL